MTLAVVFPGQGSQRPGMAVAWQDVPSASRWAEASELLGWNVARLGTHADADELREPAACQIALYVHHVVLLEAWRAAGSGTATAVAGHSLGEYDALVAAGALSFADGLRLVDARAQATQAAAQRNPGSMLACVGYPDGVVEVAAAAAGAFIANDNAPGQVVVAGRGSALDALRERLGAVDGRTLSVNVAAAYHSPHMEPAVAPLGRALDAVVFADGTVPVVANVDAAAHILGSDWPDLLRRQVVSPVRWRASILALAALGVTEVVELAAAPVLVNMVKRIDRSLGRRSVTTPEEL